MSRIRDMNTLVGMLDRGRLVREGSVALSDVMQKMNEVCGDIPKKKVKGQVTIKLDLVLQDGLMSISGEVVAKPPKSERPSTVFWLDKDGELTTEHPAQADMFGPREVAREAAPRRRPEGAEAGDGEAKEERETADAG